MAEHIDLNSWRKAAACYPGDIGILQNSTVIRIVFLSGEFVKLSKQWIVSGYFVNLWCYRQCNFVPFYERLKKRHFIYVQTAAMI